LATEWRIKQLEYSWIDNMTVHRARRDFAACTADALDYVLGRHAIDGGLRAELLSAYERLDAYAEVPTMLATLRRHGLRLAIPLEWDAEDADDSLPGCRYHRVARCRHQC
jgi:2-haloacid dehalogenase